jgi:hypothetical protein
VECAPSTTVQLSESSTAAGLAGEYRLRLVATSGAKAGATSEGTLTLKPQPGDLRYRTRRGGAVDTTVIHPLYGSADLSLTAVDAVEVGSTRSMDPLQPGALAIEHRASSSKQITIRLGSEANRRDRQRVDGGYTALRLQRLDPSGFGGTWASGITGERSAGYFCAVREEGKGGTGKG